MQDADNTKYLGPLEFQDASGEFHNFEVLDAGNRLLFGCACNTGFLESGHIEKEEGESLDRTLQELLADLEVYFNDGPRFVSRIVVHGTL